MKNLKELKDEFHIRAQQARLEVECSMDGTLFADKVIIAEAPGEREVMQKLPLVGGSGSLLWKVLNKRTKLTRKDFYITNVVKRQVSFTDNSKKAVNRHELSLWIELLRWELGWLPNLRYVVALGNFALNALSGHTGITQWRGSVLTVRIPNHATGTEREVTVVCLNNPAAVLREPKLEVTFNMDMGKFQRVLEGKHAPSQVSVTKYPSITEIDRFVEGMARPESTIAHDIETIGGETACFGFADTSSTAICIALRTKTENVYTLAEERHIRRQLQRLYNSGARFVAQNGAFDMGWQWFKDRMRIPQLWFDTMLGHHTLYPQLPHNLGFITTQYTDNPYYKDEGDDWRDGADIDTFWEYNGKDCAYLLQIQPRMLNELREQGLEHFFFDHVMRLQPHLVQMTVGGILVDMEMKAALRDELQNKVATLLNEFQNAAIKAIGEEIYYNPGSPKQMSDLYFSKLKLVGRGVSTDRENRDRMFKHPRTNELARAVIAKHNEYAEEAKFFSTYVKMEPDYDNRMRCTWNQTGVQSAPGRLSSSQTLWGSGGNLQNQPDRALPMFVADPGYGFAYYDLSQVEARVVAYEANIVPWKVQFEKARLDRSYDAHRALAADLYKVPYDEVPSFDRYDSTKGHVPPEGKRELDVTIRYIAKRCRHGLNYRMGPDRLATTAGISMAEAEKAYRVYHRGTPELREWWTALEREVRDNGCLYNAYGRRYMIMERLSPEALESIVAFKPQSTNGDKNCRVIYLAHDHPKWPRRCRCRLNVHDAVIALGPLEDLPMALSILRLYAEEPIYIKGEQLIVPADTKLSYPDEKGVHRWSQLKAFDVDSASMP